MDKVIENLKFKYFSSEKVLMLNIDPLSESINIVDVIFYLRIIKKEVKPIVCVGFLPVQYLMKNSQNAILFSPGVRYIQLPFTEEEHNTIVDKLRTYTLSDNNLLKPYLKLRVDELISHFKHNYYNYTGMFLLLLVRFQNINRGYLMENFPKIFEFYENISYKVLSFYFGFDDLLMTDENGFSLKITGRKANGKILKDKNILLVDDMADEGWQNVLAKIFWNDHLSNNISSVSNNNSITWEESLAKKIQSFRPHLVLLDLRLNNEMGAQNLTDLDGFILLKWLKKHSTYCGIPVIVFTASSNAENVKSLLEAGAEAVWTKLGFDEGITMKSINDRYDKLIDIVERTLDQYYNIDVLGRRLAYDDFEEVRIAFFKKIKNLQTRIALNMENLKNETIDQQKELFNFHSYENIYIDTCAFISNSVIQNISFINTFCNLFVLTMCSKEYEYNFEIKSLDKKKLEYPKIIILNDVLDELYKHSKLDDDKQPNKWKYALLTYEMFRVMLNKNIVRTEINAIDSNNNPRWILKNNTNPYADKIFIKEIERIYKDNNFTLDIINNNKSKGNKAETKIVKRLGSDEKTLIITNDRGLTETISKINIKNVKVLNVSEFNERLNKITSVLLNKQPSIISE